MMRLLSKLRCLWPPFSEGAAQQLAPTVPGLQFTLTGCKVNFTIAGDMANYEMPAGGRLGFVICEGGDE